MRRGPPKSNVKAAQTIPVLVHGDQNRKAKRLVQCVNDQVNVHPSGVFEPKGRHGEADIGHAGKEQEAVCEK